MLNNYFVLAPSFHGATLVSLILSNHKNIVALGDTLPTLSFDQGCGCGKLVSECNFWQSLKQDVPENGTHHILPEYPRVFRHRHLNLAVLYALNKMNLRLGGSVNRSQNTRHFSA